MNLQITPAEEGRALKAAGSLDIYSADAFREALLQGLQQAAPLTLDLGAVTSCDAVALQLLCAARKSAEAAGKPLILDDLSPAVAETAAALGFSSSDSFNL